MEILRCEPLEQLADLLRDAARVAVLAVGSSLRGDDAAGLLAAEELQRAIGAAPAARAARAARAAPTGPELAIFMGHTAPENLTGEIRRFMPTHLVVIDAADLGRPAGAIDVLHADAATGGPSFSSHAMPIGVLAAYLRASTGCQVVVIGIQPGDCRFGQPVGPAVQSAARQVAAALANLLGGGK